MRRPDGARYEVSGVVAVPTAVGAVCRSARQWLPMALETAARSNPVPAAVKGASSMV
jgi:hypothetical protein